MILIVLILAAVAALSGGFIVGVFAGATWRRDRRAADLAPHEALRPLYGAKVRPIPEARGDWWGV